MDQALFHLINTDLSNAAFDAFFPWWTNVHKTWLFHWILLPLFLLAAVYAARWRGLVIVAVGAGLTWAADELSKLALKPLFHRLRPYDSGLDVILRIGKPSDTSFPSGHALDAFFLATFLAMFFPRLRWLYFALAFLMAFARVYVGVHYPTDVLGGAIIGSLLAYALVTFYRRFLQPRLFNSKLAKDV
jgi:undecaprenyl-diphosphatase